MKNRLLCNRNDDKILQFQSIITTTTTGRVKTVFFLPFLCQVRITYLEEMKKKYEKQNQDINNNNSNDNRRT